MCAISVKMHSNYGTLQRLICLTCYFKVFLKIISLNQIRKRCRLEGRELEEYLEKEKMKKEAAKKLEQAKE